jgi:uncharacterized protein
MYDGRMQPFIAYQLISGRLHGILSSIAIYTPCDPGSKRISRRDLRTMHHLTLEMMVFLFITGFSSAFIDSTVGGGGLISLPALLFTGIPPALALGTNKLAGTIGSFTSMMSYLKSGKVSRKLVTFLFPLSLIGSIAGADLVRHMPSSFLKPLVIVLLVAVTLYTILKRNFGMESHFQGITRKTAMVLVSAAAVIGFYDGFFGPGTGSFLAFAFMAVGFDFVQSSGNARTLNFASNIGALLTFFWLHAVNVEYGLVMGISMLFGAIAGSQVAIRKGVTYVRPIFICVTIVLIGKQIVSML